VALYEYIWQMILFIKLLVLCAIVLVVRAIVACVGESNKTIKQFQMKCAFG
jgi:hypothetical protein